MNGEISARPVALVSGAGSGIGAAAAMQLAAAGCDLVIIYGRNADGAATVAEQCRAKGVEAVTIEANIASDSDCRQAVAKAIEAFGRLDILVNNAGATRYVPAHDLEGLTAGDFATAFGVNVTGSYQMTRAAAPFLKRSGRGAVVNVSSESGMSGDGSSLAYAASKGALNTMTLGLARTLAPDIRVNAVCPGFVDTTWALAWQDAQSYEGFRREIARLAPLKIIPTADDIADAIVWLALGARCVTGQLLVIDGGTHLTAGSPLAATESA